MNTTIIRHMKEKNRLTGIRRLETRGQMARWFAVVAIILAITSHYHNLVGEKNETY